MNSIYRLLSKASETDNINVNDKIEIEIDLALAHDGSMPKIINSFNNKDIDIPNSNFEKLHVTVDHFFPAATAEARESFLKIKDFSKEHGVNLYHQGEGILHQVIAEKFGEKLKDKIIVGVDGHMATSAGMGALAFSITPDEMINVLTYGKYQLVVPEILIINLTDNGIEQPISGKDLVYYIISKIGNESIKGEGIIITGDGIKSLSSSQRMTIGNILGEIGAKTVYFEDDSEELADFTFDLEEVAPLVVEPGTEAIKNLDDIREDIITQVYIGGCTNGRIDDIKDVVDVLKDNKVSENTTLIICPASRNVANEMDDLGYSRIIRDSGGIIINPGCGACSGIHQGVISGKDTIVTTTPRNTAGRMGDDKGRIYLTSPRTAAKIALEGKIG